MAGTEHRPTANGPHSVYVLNEEYRKTYILEVIDRFLDEIIFYAPDEELSDEDVSDSVWCYGVNVIKCFMVLLEQHLSILRKQLLVHFFSTPGFNEFAIEMLINTLQCQVLLSEAESQRCKWAATVNWKGGYGKNIEIDLFQENRNSKMKKLVRSMGVNKTEKAIERPNKASGGVTKIV